MDFPFKRFYKQAEVSAKNQVQRALAAIKSGALEEEMLDQLFRPDYFYDCIGGLAIKAEAVFPVVIDTLAEKVEQAAPEIDAETRREYWDQFEREQKFVDEFFFGCEMRNWVIARTWKDKIKFQMTWEQLDAMQTMLGGDPDIFRKEDWWKIPCWFHIAQQGHDHRDAFKKAWKEMTAEKAKQIISELSPEQVMYYRLQD